MTQIVKIGYISTQIRGVSYSKSDAILNNQDGYLPVLRANNIQEQGLILDDFVYVPESKISEKQRILAGDVLIAASSGSISLVGKAASAKEDINAGFGAFCKILRPNTELVDPRYFANYFQTQKYRQIISNLAAGANINNLKNEHLDDLEIPLPPLAEQRRIATILDQADVLRQKRQQAIEKLDQLLQATFIDMFGDPVSNPKGWVVADFEENIDFLTGFAFKSAEFQSSGIKLCRGINVLPKKLNWNDTAHWCVNDVEKFKKFKIIKNDILVAMDRPWISSGFKIVMIQDNAPEMLLVQRVARLRIKKEFGANFIFQIFSSPKFKEHCRITETTVPHISPTDFRTFKIIKPPHKLIEKYERIASLIHIQKANMLKADIFDEKLFKSLQNKAFSGNL